MSSSEDSIEELKAIIKKFSTARDWEQFHDPKNLSMAISAEAAELMEHFLWIKPEEALEKSSFSPHREEIADELADILIYCLQFSNTTGINITEAVKKKMARNEKRFPVSEVKGVSSIQYKDTEK